MKISDKILKICYATSLIIVIIMTIIWISNFPFSKEQVFEASLFQTIVLITVLTIGTILLFYLSTIYKTSTTVGKVWLCLGLGLLFWTIGEIMFSYYELFTDIEPFPSMSDFFYLSAYILLSAGLIVQMHLTKIKLTLLEKSIIAVIFLVITIIVVITVIVLPFQEVGPIPDSEIFSYFVAALYPIFDLVLILCVLIVFAKIHRGKINIAWVILLIGFSLSTIADIIFNWSASVGSIDLLFQPYDLIYFMSYIAIINGALCLLNIMTKTFETSNQ